jgi:hypothetical protein
MNAKIGARVAVEHFELVVAAVVLAIPMLVLEQSGALERRLECRLRCVLDRLRRVLGWKIVKTAHVAHPTTGRGRGGTAAASF